MILRGFHPFSRFRNWNPSQLSFRSTLVPNKRSFSPPPAQKTSPWIKNICTSYISKIVPTTLRPVPSSEVPETERSAPLWLRESQGSPSSSEYFPSVSCRSWRTWGGKKPRQRRGNRSRARRTQIGRLRLSQRPNPRRHWTRYMARRHPLPRFSQMVPIRTSWTRSRPVERPCCRKGRWLSALQVTGIASW